MNLYEGIMRGLGEAVAYSKWIFDADSDTMSIIPVPDFEPAEIKSIRNRLGITQAVLAELMGVSIKTVEAWEGGRNMPEGPARRMLAMLRDDPELPYKYAIMVK